VKRFFHTNPFPSDILFKKKEKKKEIKKRRKGKKPTKRKKKEGRRKEENSDKNLCNRIKTGRGQTAPVAGKGSLNRGERFMGRI